MRTTLPLAVLFAAVMAVGLWVGNVPRLDIPFSTLVLLHVIVVCATGALVLYADEQAALNKSAAAVQELIEVLKPKLA